ncbi:MAG TPA: hypothetical protein VF189_04595 [Patescibacteria group bacterium]
MSTEELLKVRAHRVFVWKNARTFLSNQGQEITAAAIADVTTTLDFKREMKTGIYEYSSGTGEGRKRHRDGTREHARSILQANPLRRVKIECGKDATCLSCTPLGLSHCNNENDGDLQSVLELEKIARRDGYPVTIIRELHPLNSRTRQRAIIVPSEFIQRFVLGDVILR